MSEHFILTAIESRLRSYNKFDATNCGVMFDERPPPTIPNYFASIHFTELTPQPFVGGLNSALKVGVTITKRIQATGYDRVTSSVVFKELNGLYQLAAFVRSVIHNNASIVADANTLLSAYFTLNTDPEHEALISKAGFITVPLWNKTDYKPVIRNEEWFHGTFMNRERGRDQPGNIGLSLTVEFGNLSYVEKFATCDVTLIELEEDEPA
jgi:hypothetical protein